MVLSEEIGKEVVRVEQWKVRIIMAWVMIRKQLVCVKPVYGQHTGMMKAEKQDFVDSMEMAIGIVELETLLCIAEYCNAHGKQSQEKRKMYGCKVELMARINLAVVGSFLQKQDNHQITYVNGHHKTELNSNNIIEQ